MSILATIVHYRQRTPEVKAAVNKLRRNSLLAVGTLTSDSPSAAVAYRDDRVVGMFAYDRWYKNKRSIVAEGTYCINTERGHRTGLRMWQRVLFEVNPREVHVTCATIGGVCLVASAAEMFPGTVFVVSLMQNTERRFTEALRYLVSNNNVRVKIEY